MLNFDCSIRFLGKKVVVVIDVTIIQKKIKHQTQKIPQLCPPLKTIFSTFDIALH